MSAIATVSPQHAARIRLGNIDNDENLSQTKYWSLLALLPLMYVIGILAVEISQMFLIPLLALFLVAGVVSMG